MLFVLQNHSNHNNKMVSLMVTMMKQTIVLPQQQQQQRCRHNIVTTTNIIRQCNNNFNRMIQQQQQPNTIVSQLFNQQQQQQRCNSSYSRRNSSILSVSSSLLLHNPYYYHPRHTTTTTTNILPQQQRSFFSWNNKKEAADIPPVTSIDTGTTIIQNSNNNDDSDNLNRTSSTITTSTSDTASNHQPQLSVDETLDQLFTESSTNTNEADAAWYNTGSENIASDMITTTTTGIPFDPTWYNVADNAILTINMIQHMTGWSYGISIIATTIVLRLVLFPVMVIAQRGASRMAHVQPELTILKERYERIISPTRNDQLLFSTNMKALFTKYKCNPFQSIIAPIIQIPLFLGMFFGLKKMSQYYPTEFATGGMLWFIDLSIPDPYYILPLLSTTTFIVLTELGKEQMLQSGSPNALLILNVLRAMCLVSLPFIINFEASMLVYWISNNTLTGCQTILLQMKPIKRLLGIVEPPKPLPTGNNSNPLLQDTSLVNSIQTIVKRAQGKPITELQKIQQHNQTIEMKQVTSRLSRAARERQKKRPTPTKGITGTRNR